MAPDRSDLVDASGQRHLIGVRLVVGICGVSPALHRRLQGDLGAKPKHGWWHGQNSSNGRRFVRASYFAARDTFMYDLTIVLMSLRPVVAAATTGLR